MRRSTSTAKRRAGRAANSATRVPGTLMDCWLSEEDVGGRNVIVAHFAAFGDQGAHSVRLHGLLELPDHAAILSRAYLSAAGRMKSDKSRINASCQLKNGLARFLAQDALAGAASAPLDEDLMARFAHWLDDRPAEGGRLTLRTKRSYFQAASTLLAAGAAADLPGLSRGLLDWRFDPWAGQNSALPPDKAFLDTASMRKILSACRLATARTMSDLGPSLTMLERGAAGDPVVDAAEVLRACLPTKPNNPAMRMPGDLDGFARETVSKARRLVTPTINDLLPFLLLLAQYTAFNASTLMDLKTSGIKRLRLGDLRWIELSALKRRSGLTQRARFAIDGSETNPGPIVDFLERWTAPMRAAIQTDRLFVVHAAARIHELRDPANHLSLPSATGRWLKANDLPHTNFNGIRKAMHELAHLVSGGDEDAVRAVGQQVSENVLARHYTSNKARFRDRTRLAAGLVELERLVTSNGRIDARQLPDSQDRSAATPGFQCLDRYSHHMPGSRANVACSTFGMCPICPLAVVDVRSPRSCGYLHLLLERVESGLAGNSAITGVAYIAKWLPVARALRKRWLRLFTPAIREQAGRLKLINLPEVE